MQIKTTQISLHDSKNVRVWRASVGYGEDPSFIAGGKVVGVSLNGKQYGDRSNNIGQERPYYTAIALLGIYIPYRKIGI